MFTIAAGSFEERVDGSYLCTSPGTMTVNGNPSMPRLGTVLTASLQVSKDGTKRTLIRADAPYYDENGGGDPIEGTQTVHVVVTTPANAAQTAVEAGKARDSALLTIVAVLLNPDNTYGSVGLTSDDVVDRVVSGRFPFSDESALLPNLT